MNWTAQDVEYFADLRKRVNEPELTPLERVNAFLGTGAELVATGSFLDVVRLLHDKRANIIIGPQGGILHADQYGNLVFRQNPDVRVLFSLENYLGQWTAAKV